MVGQARGLLKGRNSAAESAFQEYTVLLEDMTAQIPDRVSFESAAVLPLGVSTAVAGLFQGNQLGLQLPAAPARKATGKTVLVWGGSTSVGSNAIQLAVAAGYEVITVCLIPVIRESEADFVIRLLRRRTLNMSRSWEHRKLLTITAPQSSRISSALSKAKSRPAQCQLDTVQPKPASIS